MDVGILYTKVERLLKESGFVPELYILSQGAECISVLFDKKEAVEYFQGDFNKSELADKCLYEYKKVGKKHAAYIYF